MHRLLSVPATCALAASAAAQITPASLVAREARQQLELAATSATAGPGMHGTVGNDFTSAYYFRGMLQENQGTIGEPYLELDLQLWDSNSSLRSLDLVLGQWNSLHDGPTGTGGPQSIWFENDLYAGLQAKVDDHWLVTGLYTVYYSPNRWFETVQEVSLAIDFDDGDLFGNEHFGGFQPSVLVAIETAGHADSNGSSGSYGEIAIAPKFPLGQLGEMPVDLSFPTRIGVSLHDYYESPTGNDSAFGYVDVGAVAHAPLNFLPARLGPWECTFGAHALVLGDRNKELNSGDRVEFYVTAGLSTTF